MPRLIDADALADELAVLLERNTKLIDEWLANLIEDAVDDAPAVEAEPVTRCKDCESWGLNAIKKDEKGEVIYGDCLHFCCSTPKWFYCAWGERKNGQ